jgi:hypothetical protein
MVFAMASRAVLRHLANALVLGLAEAAVVLGLAAVLAGPAAAQHRGFDDRFPFLEERARRGYSGGGGSGFFGGGLFGNPNEQKPAPVVENNSKAPPPAKKAADASAPLTSVVVLGDSMADWLAYGLEQAAAESPDIGILRRHRTYSGLIRIEVKNDPRGEYPDWPQAARDILNADKANFIVVMIGLNDRRPIRDKAPAPAKTSAPGAAQHAAPGDKKSEPKDAEKEPDEAPAEQQAATVEPHERAPAGMVNYEFRSDKWTELYIKRIDDFIAVLKAKNVPVFWVGLPPVRSPKISADLSYLNDLYRSRAEKAGITYIDTWDGFVDEQGRFVMQGPDFEGQIRRLRSGDGTHFTQPGARKLAHYVEREIQRALMTHATPVSLPVDEPAPQATAPTPPKPGAAAIARPLAGPVMPLTTAAEADQLLGGPSAKQDTVDPIASRVLVRGEPNRVPVGRADDFAWPRRTVLPQGADPVVATSTTPITPMQPYETRQAAVAPAAAPAQQRIGPPAPVRQAATQPAPPRQTGFFGSWGQQPQQQQAQRRIEPARQPFFFPFFGGR